MLRQRFEEVATRPEGSSGNDFVDTILNERRKLRGRTAYLPCDGHSSHVARIVGLFYKGAKKGRTTDADTDRERRIVQHMQCRVPYIPVVVDVGEESVFFAVTTVPGVPFEGVVFDKDRHALLEPAEMKNIAKELAGFVASMARAFTDEEATQVFGLKPERPDLDKVRQAINDPAVKAALGARLPACERLVQEYIDAFSQKEPIVIHADLHMRNCFIDPETKMLSGVIDFGTVKYCVPEAEDYNRILLYYPQEFAKDFCDACEEQGLPISYRHRQLYQFSKDINRLPREIMENDKPTDLTLKQIDSYISQLDEPAARAPAQKAAKGPRAPC